MKKVKCTNNKGMISIGIPKSMRKDVLPGVYDIAVGRYEFPIKVYSTYTMGIRKLFAEQLNIKAGDYLYLSYDKEYQLLELITPEEKASYKPEVTI